MSAAQKRIADYGAWKSGMDLSKVFAKASAPAYPFEHNGDCFFQQTLPQQAGRAVLVGVQRGKTKQITPGEFDLRSRVHEYGGRCFCVIGDDVAFNHFKDGGVYRHALRGGKARKVFANRDEQYVGFADLVATPDQRWIIGVGERRRDAGENENQLVAFDAARENPAPIVLASGADFYAAPRLSGDQTWLAWFEWDHPNMPWDESRLRRARFCGDETSRELADIETVFEEADVAVCQIGFMRDNSLLFISEKNSGYWNFFRACEGNLQQLTDARVEYGDAHWQFGQTRWRACGDSQIIAIAGDAHGDSIVLLDWRGRKTAKVEKLCGAFAACTHLSGDARRFYFVAASSEREPQVMQLARDGKTQIIYPHAPTAKKPAPIKYQAPRAIEFPTRDGDTAHALFYPPTNPDYAAPRATLPPLMVVVHGGPTARAGAELHPLKQYFVSLGFALLDVNHRGSTGYGRAYRQRLLGAWGIIDADDIADAVAYALQQGLADPAKVCIRGGSAGGYAVLRALTRHPKLFAAGACYYGIGNLITLCEITHKFESRYTERLVGEVFDPAAASCAQSLFVKRSPIFDLHALASPLILFQGLDDKVVPPKLSREVAAALKQNGVKHAYHEYAGEAHGFRRAQTRVDSLQKEVAFFQDIIGAKPA